MPSRPHSSTAGETGSQERDTTGATLYPVGVLVAFMLLSGNGPEFKMAVLMLAFGDALAAAFGRAVAWRRYLVFGEPRSLSGSV